MSHITENQEDAARYGKFCRHLVDMANESPYGMDNVMLFLSSMSKDDVDLTLAHFVFAYAKAN